MARNSLGIYGEVLAELYLKAQGYRILDKNFKNKIGEIDLIAKEGDMICFVEVKTRVSLACGLPVEAITRHKQLKIVQMAWSYLKYKFGTVDKKARFDVVSIYKDNGGKEQIELIKNAFDAPY